MALSYAHILFILYITIYTILENTQTKFLRVILAVSCCVPNAVLPLETGLLSQKLMLQ